MLYDSRLFNMGQMSYLMTPKLTLSETGVLKFWLFFNATEDSIADLSIYLANEIGFADRRLPVKITPTLKWKRYRVPFKVQPGYYQVVFKATCGRPFESYIAIDSIKVSKFKDERDPNKLKDFVKTNGKDRITCRGVDMCSHFQITFEHDIK